MARMAREILFRGFNAESKQWIHGNLISGDYFFILSDIKESEEKIRFTYFKVIPDSVGQFTGLTDKNGKKIFEGDIVENHTTQTVFNADIRKYESISNTTRFCVVFYSNWGYFKFTEESERGDFTVIGNIFENPELLETENKKAA